MPDPRIAAVLKSIASNVRRARLRAQLTQEALAEIAEMDARFVQRVETGEIDLRIGTLVRLASALNVRPPVLLKSSSPIRRRAGRPSVKSKTAGVGRKSKS